MMNYSATCAVVAGSLELRGHGWSWWCHLITFPIHLVIVTWFGFVCGYLIRRIVCARREHVWKHVRSRYCDANPPYMILYEECSWCHYERCRKGESV